MRKKIIFLLGKPGSGKGTQGAFLSKKLNLPHYSTGDILRKISSDESENSKLFQGFMNSGRLLPDNLVNDIVKKFIISDNCVDGCILDGYPRTIEQFNYFVKNVSADIFTVFFDIVDDIAKKRILGRMSCNSCNKIYNKYCDQTKIDCVCDDCGSTDFVSRVDSGIDTILSRMAEYKAQTLPLVDYCKKIGNFFVVNAAESKDQVSLQLLSIVKKI